MRVFKNKLSQRLVIGASLALGLTLLGGGFLWLATAADRAPATVAANLPTLAAAGAPTAALTTPSASAPLQAASPSTPTQALSPTQATPDQLAQIEAQWCTHGLQAHRQSLDSFFQSNRDASGMPTHTGAEALRSLPTTQARMAVQSQLLREWVERLQSQGDPRSVATALYLQVDKGAGWSAASEAAFLQMARTTSDPYVLHLWRQHDTACRYRNECAVPLAKWSTIEPDNLLAWLPPGLEAATLTDTQWQGVAQAKYAKAYYPETQARLLALTQELKPGLRLDVGLEFITNLAIVPDVVPARILSICEPDATRRERRQACLHGANLLWSAARPSLLDRAKSLALVKALGAHNEAHWPARIQEGQALGNFTMAGVLADDMGGSPTVATCEQLETRRQRLVDITTRGTWALAQSEGAANARR